MPANPIIEMYGVSKRFHPGPPVHQVLRGITLQIARGEIVALWLRDGCVSVPVAGGCNRCARG